MARRQVTRRGFLKDAGLAGGAALAAAAAARAQGEDVKKQKPPEPFKLFPVGKVERKDGAVRLRIDEKYAPAVKGLEGFSHVWVFYWFDRNDTPRKRSILQVHPRGNRSNPLTGVFACRAPVRPNLIALSLCKIVSIEGGVIRVEAIDAFDETPIVDLKPYCPGIDRPAKGHRVPDWLRR